MTPTFDELLTSPARALSCAGMDSSVLGRAKAGWDRLLDEDPVTEAEHSEIACTVSTLWLAADRLNSTDTQSAREVGDIAQLLNKTLNERIQSEARGGTRPSLHEEVSVWRLAQQGTPEDWAELDRILASHRPEKDNR